MFFIVPITAISTFFIAAFFGWAITRRIVELRLEERVSERTRIARELHDTLLQSLHGVMFEFQAARNLFQKRPEEALQALDGALMGTERAITESQDAIENLRETATAEDDLTQLLKITGEDLAALRHLDSGSPTFSLTVEGQQRALAPIIRDEIYGIAREVLRNAFRHSQAHRIEAEILYDEHQLRLRVRDDGKGMDPQVLEKGRRAGHWGLPGVRERAQQMGAKLDVWSEAGAGTEVQLAVAASVAYRKDVGSFRVESVSKGWKFMSVAPSLIRILTVDDHPLLRKGIAALVNTEDDMKLVAEASSGEEAIEKFRAHRPDVTLMDIQLPGLNGIETISQIHKEFPNARIIVLTTYSGDMQVVRAIRAGARAYLLKRQVHRELLETIRAVHAGQRRIPQEIAVEFVDHPRDDLTPREIDVLRLIASGNANKEIADQLSIGEASVKSYVANILSKLDAKDRAHAVAIGLKRGIIEL